LTEETQTDATSDPIVLELECERVIRMRFGAFPYTWHFRRIGINDWKKFFGYFDTETTQIHGEEIQTFEIETGLVELARSTVVAVEGYAAKPEGRFEDKLPHAQLKQFGQTLRDVRPSPMNDETPLSLSDLHEVEVDCTWSLLPSGKMGQFNRMAHRLRPPTLEQQRAYNRACATFRIKGDSRGGQTIWPAKQAIMMDFYDSLIESVDELYQVGGKPLVGAKNIALEMDGCHKVAAVQAFLNAGGVGILDVRKPEGRLQ
jgi:hypothetical protein